MPKATSLFVDLLFSVLATASSTSKPQEQLDTGSRFLDKAYRRSGTKMCKSNLHALIERLPKCEHHIHLEGALTPELLFSLAQKNNISLPSEDPAFESPAKLNERYRQFSSLDDFLGYYYIGMSVLIQESDFEALAMDYFRHAAKNGVLHADVFFDPQAHLSRGLRYTTVLSGFSSARAKAEAELGVTSELVCCFLRHLPVSECVQTFRLEDVQKSFKSGAVKGIGLDSSELNYPPELFKEIYEEAEKLGLRRTAHAGEEGPASYIESALNTLSVERIDHGIRLGENSALLERVAREKKLLTVCPISNVFLRCVKDVSELPIRQFLDAGIAFSINSDDPAYFGANYILDNYCAVQGAFDLSVGDWTKICKAAIEGSWCSDLRKREIGDKLQDVLSTFA